MIILLCILLSFGSWQLGYDRCQLDNKVRELEQRLLEVEHTYD